ncbi:MAG: amino acid ABC transporter substrate-binding protein [Candidatus Accumulibacter sp.]|uniref:amino acid ABC transporter substrate-binding protein n=1 Tax=Accumulibacter sp. TaxID=2053492 RepID=UPI0025D6D072|nr:amino acid ABC transporter substrate-binding protein [Accumulibacter sp.]MCP5249065.1 amino acid ABC transporter substrate-binding protein [Accumulibacter sp.]
MNFRTVIAAAVAASCFHAAPAAADESTLAKIKQTSTIKLGYRESSPPFSFVGDDKKAHGYSIDLCTRVAADIAEQLKIPQLNVQWVPVSAQSRFEALKNGEIDIECGNTTQTLSRRADFDFSLMTFVDGASLLYRAGENPKSVADIMDQRIVVVAGTTTEKAMDQLLASEKPGIRLIKVKDHKEALAALQNKTATAYAADRTVLITTAILGGDGKEYTIADNQFTYEPYGLMMRRDADLRLAVDRSLAQLYRSGEIGPVLQNWFGALGKPGDALKVMILLNGLPQ